jgi:hypothetical protein
MLFADERHRRSNVLLLVFGLLLVVAYLANSVVIYDDLYMPAYFSGIVSAKGNLSGIWMIFTGADLPLEYRTYGVSRVLQFVLWNVVGAKSFVYPLIIATSQLATAFVLGSVLRRAHVSEPATLLVASAWLISPFSLTWTFHHYSYLILPFQLLVLTVFVFQRMQELRRKYLVAGMLGVGCALTGEMQLPAAFTTFLLVLILAKDKGTRKAAGLSLFVFALSLALHRMNWAMFIRADHMPQRFSFHLADQHFGKLAGAVGTAIGSIYVAFEQQVIEMLRSGMLWGLGFAIGVMACFIVSIGRCEVFRMPFGRIETKLAALLFLVGAISISLYVVIGVTSGASVFVMPRRYGYIPLTLMVVAVVLVIAELLNLLSWPDFGSRRISYALGLGFFAMLAGQLHIRGLPAERQLDKRITSEVLKARGDLPAGQPPAKTALLFVGSDSKYRDGVGDGSAIGPKMAGFEQRELSESPWGIYWTSKSHLVDFLGFKYAAMASHCMPDASDGTGRTLRCDSEWAHPIKTNTVKTKDVVVIANLGLEQFDPRGERLEVFDSYEAFKPNDFGRRIERGALSVATAFSNEFIVDLGQKNADMAQVGVVFPDKAFVEPLASASGWVSNYGRKTGDDGVYTHLDIRDDLSSFRTNRNGAFSYGFEFKDAVNVEIGLDFWEQWGRKPGERLFTLEITWNAGDWASVGVIDMAAINGDKPFSIILNKRAATSFEFRLKPVAGSKDVPAIQNIRMHRT